MHFIKKAYCHFVLRLLLPVSDSNSEKKEEPLKPSQTTNLIV